MAVLPLQGAPVPAKGPTPKTILLAGSKGLVPVGTSPKSPCILFPSPLNNLCISLQYLQLRFSRLTNQPVEPFLPILRTLPFFLSLLSVTSCGNRCKSAPSQGKQQLWAPLLVESCPSGHARPRSSELLPDMPRHTWDFHRRGNIWWPYWYPNRRTSFPRDKPLTHFTANTLVGIHNAGIRRRASQRLRRSDRRSHKAQDGDIVCRDPG